METIRGRTSFAVDVNKFKEQLASYDRVLLDLGTGDGRYVRTLAHKHPNWFIIGVDACRENLREHSQAKLQNMLFIIASAQNLPKELNGQIPHITINFPWGSLLESLLKNDPLLMRGLDSISHSAASLDLHLNAGALAEAGTQLEVGVEQIYNNLLQAGWRVKTPIMMNPEALKTFPSTWAKRLAIGRNPRAVKLTAQR